MAPLPKESRLLQNHPNPFNPSTLIRFELREASRVTLAVYDVAGRLVAKLVDKSVPAGRYEVLWDGRNENGTLVASGVYFVFLKSTHGTRTIKILLAK